MGSILHLEYLEVLTSIVCIEDEPILDFHQRVKDAFFQQHYVYHFQDDQLVGFLWWENSHVFLIIHPYYNRFETQNSLLSQLNTKGNLSQWVYSPVNIDHWAPPLDQQFKIAKHYQLFSFTLKRKLLTQSLGYQIIESDSHSTNEHIQNYQIQKNKKYIASFSIKKTKNYCFFFNFQFNAYSSEILNLIVSYGRQITVHPLFFQLERPSGFWFKKRKWQKMIDSSGIIFHHKEPVYHYIH